MVSLEQVRQLETKIAKAIEYVNRLDSENKLLRGELENSRKRVSELESSVQRFKEDQSRIEEGIIAALDRLNQFEDAIGKNLSTVQAIVASPVPADLPVQPSDVSPQSATVYAQPAVPRANVTPAQDLIGEGDFFEDIPGSAEGDFSPGEELPQDSDETGSGELDIF